MMKEFIFAAFLSSVRHWRALVGEKCKKFDECEFPVVERADKKAAAKNTEEKTEDDVDDSSEHARNV